MDKISRDQALAEGRVRFFTGLPCLYGHVCERLVTSYECTECKRNRKLSSHRRQPPRRAKDDVERDKKTRELLKKTCREAASLGKVVFDWHIPCKNGHLAGRYVKTSQCVKCRNDGRARTRERVRAHTRGVVPPPPPNMPPIVTVKEAKKQKKSRFFTGKPCKYGHYAERYVSSGRCIECSNGSRQTGAPVREEIPVDPFVKELHKKRQQSLLSAEVEKKADESNRAARSGKGFDFQEFLRSSWMSG